MYEVSINPIIQSIPPSTDHSLLNVTILREEYRLRAFENRVLSSTVRRSVCEIVGERGKLYIEEHHNSFSTPNIIKMVKPRSMKLAGYIVRKCEVCRYSFSGKTTMK
jgi:hypothetical protein